MVDRRSFVVGDIHGCDCAFNKLVEQMSLTANDRIVILGDAIDRGPNSRAVLDALVKLRSACELIYILGNHEEMMLDALKGRRIDYWLRHGGSATLESYGGKITDVPDAHRELFDSTLDYWEGPDEICIHANLEPGVNLHQQRSDWLRWRTLTGQEFPHPSGKRVICGHSGVGYGAPTAQNGWVCLDTMAYSGGILSAMDLGSGEILQARQNGDFRRGFFLHEIESKDLPIDKV